MRKQSGGMTGGLMMLGLAALLLTDYWWPGIMFVIGVSLALPALLRKEYSRAALFAVVFGGVPYLFIANVNMTYVAAGVLAVVGIYTIIRKN